jgi:hypothetical protein
VDLGCGQKHFLDQISNHHIWGNNDWIWAFFFFSWIGIQFRSALQKKNCKTLAPSFVFAIVNGDTVVDTRRIFTQFLIPMSWAKKNILWVYNSIAFIAVFLMEVLLNLLCWGVS